MRQQVKLDCIIEEGNPTRQQVSSTSIDQEQVILFSSQQQKASSFSTSISPQIAQNTQRQDKFLYKIFYILLIVGALLFIGACLIQRLQMREMEKALSQLEQSSTEKLSYQQITPTSIRLDNSTLSDTQAANITLKIPSPASQALNNQTAQYQQAAVRGNATIKPSDSSFNLWDLTNSEKEELLRMYGLFVKTQENNKTMNILTESNQQATPFFYNFLSHSNEVRWWDIYMNQTDLASYQAYFKKALHYKTIEQNQFFSKYRSFKDSKQFVYEDPNINIVKSQVFDAVQAYRLTGHDIKFKNFKEINQRQNLRLEQKYNISAQKKQLRACVIVPTYNNAKNNQFIWNIESILQQEYHNYRVIIVDDGSSDETAAKIAKHLRWRNAPADKFVVLRSNTRNKSLYNFYYAVHRYCTLGEIVYTIDGDDQLIGAQVFKLINAIYQKEKVYTLYTTYLNKSHKSLRLGYNQYYSFQTIQQNGFRKDDSHSYSHLRTMMSDTFLLVNDTSFKDKDGKFYQMITDNAVYFCALQLSCKRVRHLQEINYLYNFQTGINIINTANKSLYNQTMEHISNAKPYLCIDDYLQQAKRWYNTLFKP